MNYTLGILHAGNRELFKVAIASVPPFHGNIHVIDNSRERWLQTEPGLYEVHALPVPLTFTQSMNWLQLIAKANGNDVLFWMHDDGEVGPGVAEEFIDYVRGVWERGEKFGVIFTHYDVFCAFNMKACEAAGQWDTYFTQYWADCDYYKRLRDAGFPEINSPFGDRIKHVASATLKHDADFHRIVDMFAPFAAGYYKLKHGSHDRIPERV
jgi:hypothetical protein